MIEAEIGDYNEDDSIDVHNVLLFIIIVCFEIYQPKNQGKELKQKKIVQVDERHQEYHRNLSLVL